MSRTNSGRACHGPVRAAVGNAFSETEIEDLIFQVSSMVVDGATPAEIRRAVAKVTKSNFKEGLIKRRMKAAAAGAKLRREPMMAAMPDVVQGKAFDAADKLRAYDTGSEKLGVNLGFSTEAEVKGRWLVELEHIDQGIEASGGKGLLDPLFNKAAREAHEDDVTVEMARLNGAGLAATGNEMAAKQAKVFSDSLERTRLVQNNAGAWIDKRPGYVARQMHDQIKVGGGFWGKSTPEAKAEAFKTWAGTIRPLLDDATFDGLEASDFDAGMLDRHGADLKAAFLDVVWNNIIHGRMGEPGSLHEYEFTTPASLARSASRGRSLHFKDPKAWLTYHRQFGQGSLYEVILNQVQGGQRNAAIMNRWGPNPEAARAAHIKGEIKGLRNSVGAAAEPTIARLQGALDGGQIHWEWQTLTGAAGKPKDAKLAAVMNAVRIDQRLAKLGSAVLASTGPDQAIAAQVFKQHGGRYLDGYMGTFGGILRLNRAQQVEAGKLLGIGARSAAADMAGRFDPSDGIAGMGARLSQLMFKATGFEYVMESHRRGLTAMWQSFAADQAVHGFDQIEPDFRAQLEKFGIGAKDWEVMRQGVREIKGDRFLGFDHLEGDLALKARAYMAQFLDDSLTESGVRDRARLTFGTQPGTALGEAVRCFTQFKSFPARFVTLHLNPAIDAIRAGEAGAGGKMAHLILSATVMGFAAMQAKQLSKGLQPRPVTDEEGNIRLDVWGAALLQGGGLGIYGDFLFGNFSRSGGAIETLGGPAVGEFAHIATLMNRLTNYSKWDENTLGDTGGDVFRALKSNTPFMNTWYARAAIDHFVLNNIQEAMSPGYMERYQKRLKDEQGVEYLWKPMGSQ